MEEIAQTRPASEEARFEMRHGTQDYEVFDEVVVKNQYRLPDSLPNDSLIIDIGANIGCFAAACLLRGAGTIVCFEPEPMNFKQLVKNVSQWPGQGIAFNSCVWRSDKEEKVFFFSGGTNTACGCVTPEVDGLEISPLAIPVNSIGLDSVLSECTLDGAIRVHTLKIDAELAEYAILYTSKNLHLVDNLIVETHVLEKDDQFRTWLKCFTKEKASHEGIAEFLRGQGFNVRSERQSPDNDINTIHFAVRGGKV